MKRSSRTVTLALGHPCCSSGALCVHGVRLGSARALAPLKGGGRRAILRGAPRGPLLAALVARAHRAGFEDVVLVTAGLDEWDPDELRSSGVDAVRAVVFSHVPAVHDRLAGREGALVGALVTMRALHRAGLALELEVPLLPSRLSDPTAVVDLAIRAVGSLRAVRFYVPEAELPVALAPPSFDELRPSLVSAPARAVEAGARVRFDPSQGIVPCALGGDEAMHPLFVLPRASQRAAPRVAGAPPEESVCAACALLTDCAGPTEAYLAAHGEAGLAPFASRPSGLDGGRRSARPRWGKKEREAARHVRSVVLRPTVHCNQDCLFCSANESSGNAFSDPKTMLEAIARMAQRGVKRISFSGGEPTLSPDLPHYVEAAKRCGVEEIELVTNGVLLDREPKVRRLREAGLTHAFVSLHAHDESISSTLTQKEGDHARTLKAIELLADAGVLVAVNHVITARNQPFLSTFVEILHARFGGRVFLSFAFVTPQFKALEHAELWPRLSETQPYLMHALARAIELGQPVVVGSRQGVPPCMLGPFAAWSDVFDLAAEAASEDTPQKTRGEACARCRYRDVCNGVWTPYAQRFGTDELVAIEGEAFDAAELTTISRHNRRPPWGMPTSFDDACELLRDREAERAELPPLPRHKLALPLHRPERTRALRALLIGSGRRARELAERAVPIEGLAITAIASPHAPDARGWSPLPAFRTAEEALSETRPELAIVAAATEAHVELVRVCSEAGVPVLLEKPIARSAAEAQALEGLPGFVSCASQELFAPGLDGLEGTGPLSLSRRVRSDAPDAPRAWAKAPLAEVLHHSLSLAVRARGPLERVLRASHEGAVRPERLRLSLEHARGAVDLRLDFTAAENEASVTAPGFTWRRVGRDITRDGRAVERDGSDEERMLRALVRALLAGGRPPVSIAEGVSTLEAVEAAVEALESAGAPFSRAGAPKHVASARYRVGGSGR